MRLGRSACLLLLTVTGCPQPDVPEIRIVSPSGTHYTNTTVTIEVFVDGGAERVELFRDATLLAELQTATFDWNTTAEPEGTYELTAVATVGGKSKTSLPVTVVVDRTPPTISSRAPLPNAVGVYAKDPIQVIFDEPMGPSSFTTANVQLSSSVSGAQAVTLSLAANELTLDVATVISPAVPATLTLSVAGVTDLAGNGLAAENWSWSLPSAVALGGALDISLANNVEFPSIAVDSTGAPIMAWAEDKLGGGSWDVHVARWDGTTWVAYGGPLDIVAANDAREPSLVLDANDYPIVAWHELDGVNETHVKRWDGTNWVSLGMVSSPSQFPSIALNAADEPVVAWDDSSDVRVLRYNGASWSPMGVGPLNVDQGQSANRAWMKIGADENPVVVWSESQAAGPVAVFAKKWDGNAFVQLGSSELNIDGADTGIPTLTLTPAGDPVVAFSEGAAPSIGYVVQYNGSDWILLDTLNVDPAESVVFPVIEADGGSLMVAWRETVGGSADIRVKRIDGGVSTHFGVFDNDAQASQPTIGVNASGDVALGWAENVPQDLFGARLNQ